MKIVFPIGLVVLGFLAWWTGQQLSSDAIGLALGVIFGVMASLPGALLVLVAARREQPRSDPYYPRRYEVQRPPQPPARITVESPRLIADTWGLRTRVLDVALRAVGLPSVILSIEEDSRETVVRLRPLDDVPIWNYEMRREYLERALGASVRVHVFGTGEVILVIENDIVGEGVTWRRQIAERREV